MWVSVAMSFAQDRYPNHLSVWEEVSFSWENIFSAILSNISEPGPSYVRDVDYAVIVIPAEEQRIIVGPF